MKFVHGNDINEHARQLDGWQQYYEQIVPGKFMGALFDIHLGAVRVFREYVNLKIVQHMSLSDGNVNIIIPVSGASRQHLFLRQQSITILPFDVKDFTFVSTEQMEVICVSLPAPLFCTIVPDGDTLLTACGSNVALSITALDSLRLQLNAMIHYLQHLPPVSFSNAFLALLRDQVLDAITLALAEREPEQVSRINYSTRHYIVERCHKLIAEGQLDVTDVDTLCKQLKISRRTLQYSFQEVSGLSPVSYLRAIRLNMARNNIITAPALPVADIALKFGFYHSGYFVSEYQRLFGETPTHTRLQAAKDPVSQAP